METETTYIHNIEQSILSSIIYDNKLFSFLLENGLDENDRKSKQTSIEG